MQYFLLFFGFLFIVFFTFNVIIEPVYAFFFRKPIFVHFYLFPKKLTSNQLNILISEFEYYQKLTPQQKKYFQHRVATFIASYTFYGRENIVVTDQMRILIAATAVMLTFGMRNYLYTVFDKIIIYPNVYYSNISNDFHKGEFNPKAKAIVFSWQHFLEGFAISNDNLNLGLHEFTHAMHFQGLRKSDVSATIFMVTYDEIMEQVKYPPNLKRLVDSEYFRIYAFTNEFEFIAVLLEHFFETPQQFKAEFPVLFDKVKIMINFTETT